jgi:hypothetical protein
MNLHRVLCDIHTYDRLLHDRHSSLLGKIFTILQLWHFNSFGLAVSGYVSSPVGGGLFIPFAPATDGFIADDHPARRVTLRCHEG